MFLSLELIAQEYELNRIVVKFKSNSNIYKTWLSTSKIGQIDGFVYLLGENKTKSFLSKAIINGFKNKELKFNEIQESTSNLERIAIIEFSSHIDPRVAVGKLNRHDDVEYAELKYINKVNYLPNDSLYPYQYYLNQINVFDSWDLVSKDTSIIVAIVDTGVDYLHPDLAANIYSNPGETGLDKDGKDKSKNGIDDDNNGFIDDWHGWDFKSSKDSIGQDNNPMAGASHGTHVAGIVGAVSNNKIGISGTSIKAKILAVKIGSDLVDDRSVYNEYDGVAYAALAGAKVMNCSWGTSGYSKSEQEVISKVVSMGCVVVAAAGNDGKYLAYYPATYNGVMSVAAVNNRDERASFSNFYSAVDLCAPGVDIMSTLPFGEYGNLSGTSMASPVATGAIALIAQKFPNYTPEQLIEQLKACCDNIDSINSTFQGKLGTGRINVLKSIQKTNATAANITNIEIIDANNDNAYDLDEEITLKFTIKNYLAESSNITLKIFNDLKYKIDFDKISISVGNLKTLETKVISEPIKFHIPKNVVLDGSLELPIVLYSDSVLLSKTFINLTVNPSYRNFVSNNIITTVNSKGNIGYNDYPDNTQGLGFQYKNFPNLMYEAGLIVGTGYNRISDVTRASNQLSQNNKLFPIDYITQKIDSNMAFGSTSYTDWSVYSENNDSTVSNLIIFQKFIQPKSKENCNLVITYFDIINKSIKDYDSLYVALFFDWDIGTSGDNNVVDFDNVNNFGFVENIKETKYPAIGVKMLSNYLLNFYAMENSGRSNDNIGIHDGFTKKEKWFVISNGIYKKVTKPDDVSMIIGAGPIYIGCGDTARVAFSIFAGDNKSSLALEAEKSKEYVLKNGIAKGEPLPLPDKDEVISLFPNPLGIEESLKLYLAVSDLKQVKIEIYNSIGQFVKLAYNDNLSAGLHLIRILIHNYAEGYYFAKLTIGENNNKTIPFCITH